MATQKGLFKLKGTIGGVTFYKSGGEYLAREKGGVDGDRIKNDPAFVRTRENGMEFGRAGKNGRLLRNSMRVLLLNSADSRMVSRLTRDILRVIKTDTVNPRGLRNVNEGNLNLIKGFDFNVRGKLSTTMYGAFDVSVNRTNGEVEITVTDFNPGIMIAEPGGATHVKLVAGAAAIDFDNEQFNSGIDASSEFAIENQVSPPITLEVSLPEESTLPIVVSFGLEFYQEVNGVMYPLKNGAHNALAIVEVDKL